MWTIEFYKHVETRRPYNGARLNKCLASVRINKTGNNCLIKDLLCKKKMTKRNTITTNSSVYHKNLIDFKKIYIKNTFAVRWTELVSYCVKLMLRISGFTFFCIDRYYQAKSCDTFRVVYSIRVFERVKAILVGIMFQILFIRSGSTVAWSSLILSGDASQFVA